MYILDIVIRVGRLTSRLGNYGIWSAATTPNTQRTALINGMNGATIMGWGRGPAPSKPMAALAWPARPSLHPPRGGQALFCDQIACRPPPQRLTPHCSVRRLVRISLSTHTADAHTYTHIHTHIHTHIYRSICILYTYTRKIRQGMLVGHQGLRVFFFF